MDWFSVLQGLAPAIPALAGVIGGFIPIPGASLALSLIGKAIASKLGVPATPEAVAAATDNLSREKIAAINATLEEKKAEWAAGTEREKAWARAMEVSIAEVNATMRVELLVENRHWFFTGWRPGHGWIMLLSFAGYGTMLILAAYQAAWLNQPGPIRTLVDAWPAFLVYFGALALVNGIYIWQRSEEKKAGVAPKAAPVVPKK